MQNSKFYGIFHRVFSKVMSTPGAIEKLKSTSMCKESNPKHSDITIERF